ncbi:MAG: hypothetical protein QOI06_491 [Nocardioidaceae bacterium]|jgi:hypothetical protein|nr:hypothetical protein [Nocardioidaceae bacterium]
MPELTPDQIVHLESLERLRKLTAWQRGEVSALQRSANTAQRDRIGRLLAKHPRKPRKSRADEWSA